MNSASANGGASAGMGAGMDAAKAAWLAGHIWSRKRPVYVHLAQMFGAWENSQKRVGETAPTGGPAYAHAQEWRDRWQERIGYVFANHMPHGSGFDAEVGLSLWDSKPERLIIGADYHGMNDEGFYVGWRRLKLTITPSLQCGFTLRVQGGGNSETNDYVGECFDMALREEISTLDTLPKEEREAAELQLEKEWKEEEEARARAHGHGMGAGK